MKPMNIERDSNSGAVIFKDYLKYNNAKKRKSLIKRIETIEHKLNDLEMTLGKIVNDTNRN